MVIIMKRFNRRFENHKSSTVSGEPLSPTLSPRAGKGSRMRVPSPSLPAGRDLGRGKLVPHVGFNLLIVALIAVLLGACKPDTQSGALRIRVIADGKELVFSTADHVTVGQFLQQTDIRLGDLDRMDPPEFTQITDNMVITIVRVRDEQVCNDDAVPYQTRYISNPDLTPGTTKVAQAGANGSQRICYDVIYKDGIETSRAAGNPTILTQPTDEIIARSVDKQRLEPIAITRLSAYISTGQT